MTNLFFSEEENKITDEFLKNGYVIFPLENKSTLDLIRSHFVEISCDLLKIKEKPDTEFFLDHIQDYLSIKQLNDFRVKLINRINQDVQLRPNVFSLARTYLNWIVGNELAMQRACNLSIQIPNDTSSLLPLHADTWQGNSPYEVVFWLPLVSCYKTKSMYILPRGASERVVREFQKYSKLSSEDWYNAIKHELVWLDVPYGHGLIFSHAVFHGNRVNEEKDTRWTMNIRFKPAFSPYSSKELGESFLPITLRPATRVGYFDRMPSSL